MHVGHTVTPHFIEEKTESQHRCRPKARWLTSDGSGADPEPADCGRLPWGRHARVSTPPEAAWQFWGQSWGWLDGDCCEDGSNSITELPALPQISFCFQLHLRGGGDEVQREVWEV